MENEQFGSRRGFGTTDILLQTMLQRNAIIKHHEFSIVAPGTEIPDWISVKLESYMETPCLEAKLLPHWDTSVAGFAMSCESRLYTLYESENYWPPHAITISLSHKYSKRIEFNEWWRAGILDCNTVWVWYMSLDRLGQLVLGEDDYWVGGTDATFFRIQIQYPVPSALHTKFGIRVVYKDDVKHLYNEEEEEEEER
jgi:NADPH-dependent 7-cyano-7-deazaguanine reductase QueF